MGHGDVVPMVHIQRPALQLHCYTDPSYAQALDIFNTAIVSPVYYVMFTLLTIVASVIMFKVRARNPDTE